MSETGGLLFVLFMAENMCMVYESWQKCRTIYWRLSDFEANIDDFFIYLSRDQ